MPQLYQKETVWGTLLRELEYLGTTAHRQQPMTENREFEVKTVIYISNIKDSIENANMQVIMLNGVILNEPEPCISDNLVCTNDGIFMRGQDIANFMKERQTSRDQST